MASKMKRLFTILILVSLAAYFGYRNAEMFRYAVEVYGLFIYAGILVIVSGVPQKTGGAFFWFVAAASLPVATFTTLHLLSFSSAGISGVSGMDAWLSARLSESAMLMTAAAFLGRKVKKAHVIILSVLLTGGLLAVLLSGASRTGGIFPGEADKTIMILSISTVFLFLFYILTGKKKDILGREHFWYLFLFVVFKIPGDAFYSFYHEDTGYIFVTANILRTISFSLLLSAVVSAVLKKPYDSIYKELMKTKDHCRLIFGNIKMGIMIFSFTDDRKSVIFREINSYAARYLKMDPSRLINKKVEIASLNDFPAVAVKDAAICISDKRRHSRIEKIRTLSKDRHICLNFYPHIEDTVAMTFEDITGNVAREQKIRFLIQHDHLTGLYNRNFIPDVEKKLDDNTVYPVAVIVGDVNGLKATNDIFGHFEGDRLLKEIACVITNTIGSEDICLRYGGDEFLVISFNSDEYQTAALIDLLRKRISETKILDFSPSVSFGYSVMGKKEPLTEHVDNADQMMYTKKNEDEMNTRKSILEALLRTLKMKNIESEEHLKSVERISLLIGRSMKLSGKELDELSLISSLHDIGKINIAVEILKKRGTLTDEEWEKIRKHSSDGYNMTAAIKEFKGIAKYILFHHEQWDGKGYPYGLKGESIPILSRIVAVADAYDSMTRERHYKRIYDKEGALEEIRRNKGSQFDPDIADLLLKISDRI